MYVLGQSKVMGSIWLQVGQFYRTGWGVHLSQGNLALSIFEILDFLQDVN